MRIVLFCENKYAVDILFPLQAQADKEGGHEVLWYVHKKKIPDFPLKHNVNYTNDIKEVYRFRPDAVFAPGNIVPYYLSGVKAQIFHGYAAEKKDQFRIRNYFDLYLTQGPYFTKEFLKLKERYKDFEVKETGWTRQDWVFEHLHDYDDQKREILKRYRKEKLVLYSPTFSPKLTSLPHLKEELIRLAQHEAVVILIKLHPLTRQEWVNEYKQLADEVENIVFVEDFSLSPYVAMADLMISDTSSAVYEMLLRDKPVITLRSIASPEAIYWCNIQEASELSKAYQIVMGNDKEYTSKRRWIIENYDPYLDGKVAERMLGAVKEYIHCHGVPAKRTLNLWRKYTSIKTFGWPQ